MTTEEIRGLSKAIRAHSLPNDIDNDDIDELLAACACYLYGTLTAKQLRVSFNFWSSWAEIPIE